MRTAIELGGRLAENIVDLNTIVAVDGGGDELAGGSDVGLGAAVKGWTVCGEKSEVPNGAQISVIIVTVNIHPADFGSVGPNSDNVMA